MRKVILDPTPSESHPPPPRVALLVAAHSAHLEAHRSQLERAGYQVLHTDCPMEAFFYCDLSDIHFIMVDSVLSYSSGAAFLRALARSEHHRIPAVLMNEGRSAAPHA